MKFLHTSDLHIGKKLDGILRMDEQESVLNEIISIAKSEKVDIVLIAGDVYDTFIPSAEAENMFFNFVDALSENGICVIAISGNHDDAERLSASEILAARRGIFLCVGNNDFRLGKYGNVNLIDCGNNYLTFSDGIVECFIATVPYFGESPIGYIVDKEKTYTERVEEILKEIFSLKKQTQKGILVSHLYMLGGKISESERSIDLGGVKVVSPSAIPQSCLYTALGHLHKRQVASKSKNVIYCGAPLQYAYDEVGVEKSVTVFSVNENGVEDVKEVGLSKGRKLVKLSCNGIESAGEILCKFTDNLVDFTIFSNRPLTLDETANLKSKYKNITKLKLELNGDINGNRITGRKHLSSTELFVEFYKEKYGKEPEEDLLSVYLEIMSEE